MAEEVRAVTARGNELLRDPELNKGSAFTEEERRALGLLGLLPPGVSTLDQQMARVLENFRNEPTALDRYIYLRALQDRNETLFHAVLIAHLEEMAPIVYTPTVGEAVQRFSHIFRSTRGVYVTPYTVGEMDQIIANAEARDVGIIVCTDNEGILGIGDQGVGGIGIPIGKLALYVAAGGFAPSACLPVSLDVGTDNQALLDDPMYIGLRRPRLQDAKYEGFIAAFVDGVRRNCPRAVLQWEDFSRERAYENLERYREALPSFNDDIQGTAAVVHAALLGALRLADRPLTEERVAVVGAGAAGVGVASAIIAALQAEGLSFQEASAQVLVFDSRGLVLTDRPDLPGYKRRIAHEPGVVEAWGLDPTGDLSLERVLAAARPGTIIGLSGQPGALTESMIRELARHHERPVVFLLSNPSDRVEAHPHEVVRWTDGRAIMAVGSPFEPVEYAGRTHRFSQCNNFYVFPGIGAGAYLASARMISDGMLLEAGQAVADALTEDDLEHGLVLPATSRLREVGALVAARVLGRAHDEGLARAPMPTAPLRYVCDWRYEPRYPRYVPA